MRNSANIYREPAVGWTLGSGDRVGLGVEAVAADRNLAFQEPGLRTAWRRLPKPLMAWLGEMRVCWRATPAFSGGGRKW